MKSPKQQIDLYQSVFKKQRVLLSALHATRLSLTVVAILIGVSLATHFNTQALLKTADEVSAHAQLVAQQTTQLEQLSQPLKVENIDVQVAQLKNQRHQQQQVLASLSAQNEYKSRLFSSYFEGLARRTLDGLWFDTIQIDAGGQSIALSGSVHKAELIPQLLDALQQEPAFRGVTFRRAAMDRVDASSELLSFSLFTEEFADKTANDAKTGHVK